MALATTSGGRSLRVVCSDCSKGEAESLVSAETGEDGGNGGSSLSSQKTVLLFTCEHSSSSSNFTFIDSFCKSLSTSTFLFFNLLDEWIDSILSAADVFLTLTVKLRTDRSPVTSGFERSSLIGRSDRCLSGKTAPF